MRRVVRIAHADVRPTALLSCPRGSTPAPEWHRRRQAGHGVHEDRHHVHRHPPDGPADCGRHAAGHASPAGSLNRAARWAKGVVIGGVLLAIAMPVSVLMGRSMLVQEALAEQSSSKAAMVCTAGEARAVDGSSLTGWLFGGSYFSCGDWETREARVQRERDQAQANFLARERARQGLQ